MLAAPPPSNTKAIGVALGLGAALSLSTQDLLVKLASEDLHIMQIVFIRSVVAFAASALWVRAIAKEWSGLVIRAPRLVAARVFCNIVSWFCYYASLPYLSLPVYTAAGFTVFLFSVLLSGPILGEPLSRREWCAAAAGALGVLLIADPFTGAKEPHLPALILLLFGAFVWAISIVITRALGGAMSAGGIMFYSNLGLLVVGAAGAPLVWQAPAPDTWLLLAGIGVLSFFGPCMLITAVRYARIAVVSPTQYTMLLWATAFGYIVWGALPAATALAGALCIVCGGLLALGKKDRAKKGKSA